MRFDCPHCARTLEFSGPRPSFCGYCGRPVDPAPATTAAEATRPHLPGKTDEAVADAATLVGPSPVAAQGEAPERVGHYRLLRRLGGGGMGEVFEALHEASGQRVAVKLISADVGGTTENIERFRQEGRLASTIAHSRCVFVLSVDEEAGRPYIVMELMPGRTLDDLVKESGPLPIADALRMALDVLDGLDAAHRLGVVHRDVKPSNCFLDADGRVKVGDFGLAKSLVGDAHLTRTGTFLGTPLFASPEQVKREPVDAQSDVYSLAATLYFLLAGKAPFQTGDPMATLARIVSDDPPPLRALRPDVPAALERVILRGLERDRKRRWRTLEDFRAALTPFLPGRMTMGGLSIRFVAYQIDQLVVWGLIWGVLVRLFFGSTRLLVSLVTVLYFGILEGLWGCALGKWLLRLRVSNVADGSPPGLLRGLIRAFCFNLLMKLSIWLTVLWALWMGMGVEEVPTEMAQMTAFAWGSGMAALAGFVAGVGAILLPMRKRNGYRGLHEFLTGTRVVQLPWPRRRRPFERRPFEIALSRPTALPENLGSYRIKGALIWQDHEKTLLAEDPALGRSVWIWLRPVGEPPLDRARREINRGARLRWLACGTHAGWQWDAFLAPAGSPLPTLVAEQRRLGWADVRPVLEQLAEEMTVACQEGTLPQNLTADQVWLDTSGGVQLLGTPLTDSAGGTVRGGAEGASLPDQERALALLGEVAVLALEGRRPPGEAPHGIAAPLPGDARRVLDRLLTRMNSYMNVRQLHEDLQATHDQPAEVTRWQRLRHLAVQAALLFFAFCCCFLPASFFPGLMVHFLAVKTVSEAETALQRFDHGAYGTFVAGSLAVPVPGALPALGVLDHDLRVRDALRVEVARSRRDLERLKGLSWLGTVWEEQFKQNVRYQVQAKQAELRDHPFREARYYRQTASGLQEMRLGIHRLADYRGLIFFWVVAVLLACPVAWVVWAFLARGGVSWRLAGIALVRRDGRRAARWQCAWRAFLVWAPVSLLLIGAAWWELEFYAEWLVRPTDAAGATLGLSHLCQALALLLLPVYVALALWQPTRALHDRLAGTYLVPR